MEEKIKDIYNLIQELSWYFGSHAFNGECCDGLTLVEFMTLKRVHENENMGVQELANALNVTKSGASKIIDRLENKAYVVRENSVIDGRVCCVVMTVKGREIIESVTERYAAYIKKLLNEFDTNTVETIKNAIELLVGSVQKQGYM